MHLPSWLKTVGHLAPLVLAATPLAPIAPFVAAGIQAAEQIDGATGEQKLAITKAIVENSIAATNAQAGKVVVEPVATDQLFDASVAAVVAATNLKHKDPA